MPNDSSTGGYIVPVSTAAPVYDDALEDLVQAAIVGITGLAATLVRPRFQPEPPDIPDFTTNWAAFGMQVVDHDTNTYEWHDHSADTNGGDHVERDEKFEVFISFYGPASSFYMALWRDGLSIEQNRWSLYQSGIRIIEPGKAVRLPALFKEKWTNRVDIKTMMNRRAKRIYPIRDLVDVTGTLIAGDTKTGTVSTGIKTTF